jgi:aminoglycoside 6-adenylyltransferase
VPHFAEEKPDVSQERPASSVAVVQRTPMKDMHQAPEVARQLMQWAKRQDSVRAMLLTSTRANPHASVDLLSDYDVILVVRDIRPFFEDRTWLQDFGQVLVSYWDPICPAPDYDIEQVANVIQYADGLEIDFTLWPVELLRCIAKAKTLPADLDVGYAVLVDKDHLTNEMQAPTYTAYTPRSPTEEEYQKVVEDFFSDAPYMAKCLWRDELMPAKWCLDYDMKHNFLRQMLEWRMELDHGWSVPTGALGKGLKKRLPPEIWSQLESTYVGAGIEKNWDALFKTITLLRQVAIEVADHLGYTYPHDLDQGVTTYMQNIRRLGGSMSEFPILQTKRLVLREFRTSDAHAVFGIFSHDAVTKYHNVETMQSVEQAEKLVKARASVFERGLGVRWAIVLRERGDGVIGSCGYYNLNQMNRSAEIGYDLHPAYWRQGIMTEALRAVIEYGFNEAFRSWLNRIEALTYVEHEASAGLLRKLGFQEEGIRREYGYWKGESHDLRSFALLCQDWVKQGVHNAQCL